MLTLPAKVSEAPTTLFWKPALGKSFAVTGGRGRHDEHTGADDMRSPTQIEIIAEVVDPGVEPLEGREQVGTDEDAATLHRKDVAYAVVLFLV